MKKCCNNDSGILVTKRTYNVDYYAGEVDLFGGGGGWMLAVQTHLIFVAVIFLCHCVNRLPIIWARWWSSPWCHHWRRSWRWCLRKREWMLRRVLDREQSSRRKLLRLGAVVRVCFVDICKCFIMKKLFLVVYSLFVGMYIYWHFVVLLWWSWSCFW